MINQNRRDRESWLREKTLESFKENEFLLPTDIVLVAENGCFYEVISETTDLILKNNLYGKIIPSDIIGNVTTANRLINKRRIILSNDVNGECIFDGSSDVTINVDVINDSHTHSNNTINSLDARKINTGILHVDRIPDLDASKITSGIIDIARLPSAALERLIEVPNDTARFALTKEDVNMGDVVKVVETLKMYKVINVDKLNTEEGYSVFVAGSAAEVPWEGVQGKPSTMPNPFDLVIKLNGTTHTVYNGEFRKEINILPNNIGTYTYSQIDQKLNTKANALHGLHVPEKQSVNNATFLRNDNTWQKVTPQNIGAALANHTHPASQANSYSKEEIEQKLNTKANISHGTHVPTPQSANNKVFLRNDNTWHEVTPSNIGAQPAGDYASRLHSHLATHITQDSNNRFVSDAEKNNWNNKLSLNGGTVNGSVNVTGTVSCKSIVLNGYTVTIE